MKFLTFADLKERGHPYCRVHTDRQVKAGKFPAPVKLGDGPHGRVVWIEEEINAFYEKKAAEREKVAA